METNSGKNTATLLHLSALTQYLIPFGNFIFPIIIWSSAKDTSPFIDRQGRQAINFHLSFTLYSIVLACIAIPIFIISIFSQAHYSARYDEFLIKDFNFAEVSSMIFIGILALTIFGLLKVLEFFLIIYAAVRTSNGVDYKYPLTINFLKESSTPINPGPTQQEAVVEPSIV